MMKLKNKAQNRWAKSYAAATTMLVMAQVPASAQAQNQAGIENMVQSILNLLTGPMAKGIAAIALVIAGYMFFFGNASKSLLLSIVVGCFIVFSSSWIIDQIAG